MNKLAKKFFKDYFKKNGFKNKGNLMYLLINDVFIICEYQSGRYINGFFLNFGLAFKKLSSDINIIIPKIDDCTFVGRYEQILNSTDNWYKEHFFFETYRSDNYLIKFNEIADQIEKQILPIMYKMSNYKYYNVLNSEKNNYNNFWMCYIKEKEFLNFIRNQTN